jgi:hypothetical protein
MSILSDNERRELYIEAFELLARVQTLLLNARVSHEAKELTEKEKSLCCHTLASLVGKPLC